jgi:hypothetical protein
MIENTDFRFRDDLTKTKDGQTVAIEILTKPYEAVIFRYTQVGVKELIDGTAVLQFSYDILETPTLSELTLRQDKRFEKHLGILLNHLILEAAEAPTNADREDNLEEPVEERTVHKESSSIS